MHCEFTCHAYLGDLPSPPHRQVKEKQRVALLADVSEASPVTAGQTEGGPPQDPLTTRTWWQTYRVCAFLIRFHILSRVRWRTVGGGSVMTAQPSNWRHLAELASKEGDPRKLMSLIDQLNRVLEQNELSSGQRPTPGSM
jgi:hypothetical protein